MLEIMLFVDVEPDERLPPRPPPDAWVGFEKIFAAFERARPRIAAATGSPARFGWFLRMDPQIELAYGDPCWVARRYERELALARERGDVIGLHTHSYLWEEPTGWLVEHADQAWIDHSLEVAFASYRKAFDEPCRFARMGDRFMNTATSRTLGRLGAELDFTVEPGAIAKPKGLIPTEPRRGEILHHQGVPKRPYRPALDDWRREDRSRTSGLRHVPLTTWSPDDTWTGFLARRWDAACGRAVPRDGSACLDLSRLTDELAAWLPVVSRAPWVSYIAHSVCGREPERLARVEGIVEHLIRRPDARSLVFTPLPKAVAALLPDAASRPLAGGVAT